jgi:hypothetical protein
MESTSHQNGFVKEMSQWCFCVVLAMAVQMLLLLLWSFVGPGNDLDRIMDCVYGSAVHGIATLFFEEQMFPGNTGLGLALLFLTVMLYSAAAGSIVYLGIRILHRGVRRPGKTGGQMNIPATRHEEEKRT